MKDDGPIPTTLVEAFVAIRGLMTEQELAAIRAQPLEEFLGEQHFNLGMALRNRWLYPRQSPLRQLFRSARLFHTDNMSAALLRAFHHQLTSPSFDADAFLLKLRQPWDRKPTASQLAAALERHTGESIAFTLANEEGGDSVSPKLGELRHEASGWCAELEWREAWVDFTCTNPNLPARYFSDALRDVLAGLGSPFLPTGRPPRLYRQLRWWDWARLQVQSLRDFW